jgi:hypothetical protein
MAEDDRSREKREAERKKKLVFLEKLKFSHESS